MARPLIGGPGARGPLHLVYLSQPACVLRYPPWAPADTRIATRRGRYDVPMRFVPPRSRAPDRIPDQWFCASCLICKISGPRALACVSRNLAYLTDFLT